MRIEDNPSAAERRPLITVVLVDDEQLTRVALTDRELEIFKRLASGKSNHQIARDLALSPNTVGNHVASILAKLHLENRIQAAADAVRSGIS
jgi:two-component system, NarL family, nitrate/nitrite response regulator NarL